MTTMLHTISDSDHAAFAKILRELEDAWNAGNGAAFGAPMTEDADFVTVRAEHLRGRPAIIASHGEIFSTIYAGSHNQLHLQSSRMLRADVAVLHVRAALDAPTGPLAGRHEATFSAVLVREAGEWQIASFHITLDPTSSTQP